MNKKICVVSCFLIIKFCFSSTLQLSESGLYMPKDIFFKIAEYIVPNLLTPTHPKEIAYQDAELKSYRLVCKKWQDLLDQRVYFDAMNTLFVQMGWNNQKFFNYYKERLDTLANSYIQRNIWFVNQYDVMEKNNPKNMNYESKRTSNSNTVDSISSEFFLARKEYRKIMKKKLALYHYDGLLMLEKYVFYKGFLHTNSLIRFIYYLYVHVKNNPNDVQQFNLLKRLTVSCDLTDLFSRLFKRCVLRNEPGHVSYLKEALNINYRRFLYNIYVSFSERRTIYSLSIVRCSSESFISEFFNFYSNVFSLKDSCHKYFLYYLLLYSKNCFFNIQLILLIDFIRGIKKQFVDYPESDRIEYKNLLEKNFLAREDRMCSGDSVFLKNYFGIPFI